MPVFFFSFCQLQALFMPYDHKNTTPNGASAHLMRSVLENLNHRHFQDSCLVGSGGGSVGYVLVTCFLFYYFYLDSFVVCHAVKFFHYIRCVRLACQPTSQQYCSLILNQHQPSATSQSAILFSYNKSAPAISHSQANTAIAYSGKLY